MSRLASFIRNESGATAVEYGLIVTLIAVACIGAYTSVGTAMSAKFSFIATRLN